MEKRKTTTSSEVKMRYMDKTYKNFVLHCRLDSDADVIKAIADLQNNDMKTTEAILYLIRQGMNK